MDRCSDVITTPETRNSKLLPGVHAVNHEVAGGSILVRDEKSRKWHVVTGTGVAAPTKRIKVTNTADAAEIARNWERHGGTIHTGITAAFDKLVLAQ